VPTIQIGNIHPNVLEEDLQAIVSQFGTVVAVTLQRDATGSSKGSAEVLYSDSEGAQLCIEVSSECFTLLLLTLLLLASLLTTAIKPSSTDYLA
jgi:RNA recognition motif-containing protein